MLSHHPGTVKVSKHSYQISVEKGIQSQKSAYTAVLASCKTCDGVTRSACSDCLVKSWSKLFVYSHLIAYSGI